MKLKSKQEITDLINSGLEQEELGNLFYGEDHYGHHVLFDYDEFKELDFQVQKTIYNEHIEEVYYSSSGDGRPMTKTFLVKPYNVYITIDGIYSSWEGPTFSECYLSESYLFQETRYRKANKC